MKRTHKSHMKEGAINQGLCGLHDQLLSGTATHDERIRWEERREHLDANNPDFHEMLPDLRENLKMLLLVLILALCAVFDLLLLYAGLSIVIDEFGLPSFLKFVLPVCFVVLEMTLSYFSLLRGRTGVRTSWLSRHLQYFMLFVLVGLSILAGLYSYQSYSRDIDGSLLDFITGIFFGQFVLFIASALVHIGIIRYAEEIAEACAYMAYAVQRKRIVRKCEGLKRQGDRETAAFKRDTLEFSRMLAHFRREYRDVPLDFNRTVPKDLRAAIQRVMGVDIFTGSSSFKNVHYEFEHLDGNHR